MQDPLLSWTGQVPLSTRFDDPYYSLQDGLAETRHVFLAGNDLPARLCPGFRVAELGFGTGLNLLALVEIAAAAQTEVHYTGFEAYPLSSADLSRALAPWTSLAPWSAQLASQWPETCFTLGPVRAQIVIGDARETLPAWGGTADAWFLDGFAPAKNPDLWAPDLLAEVARHTAPGGTFATYTAAGAVRRALQEAGFNVERCPGYGRKRHMTRGVLA